MFVKTKTAVCLFVCLEPGYYEDGAFGIRIENVLLVKPVELEVKINCKLRFVWLNYTSTVRVF